MISLESVAPRHDHPAAPKQKGSNSMLDVPSRSFWHRGSSLAHVIERLSQIAMVEFYETPTRPEVALQPDIELVKVRKELSQPRRHPLPFILDEGQCIT